MQVFFENFSIDMPFAVRITSLSGVHIFHKNKDIKTALPVAAFVGLLHILFVLLFL